MSSFIANNIFILQIFCICSHIIDSKYNHTKQIFVNSYPCLFPGGIGDIYDIEQGEVPIKEWGQHLLQYYDGQFLDDSLFGLSFCNLIQQHTNNREGNFFFNSDLFIRKDPPTVEQLKRQLENKNTKYTSMLRHFARNIDRNCDVLPIYYDLLIVMFVRFFFRVRRLKCTLDIKKHLILMFCIRFMIGSYYLFLTVVLIMSLLYAARFFVTAADVATEALARLVGYQWRFSQRV